MNEAMSLVPNEDVPETSQIDTESILEAANDGAMTVPEIELPLAEDVETPVADLEIESEIERTSTPELLEADSPELTPIEHLVAQLPEVTNLGNELNRVETSDSGVILETTPKDIETKELVAEDILASYKERFGINKEDLEGIEGFETLSRGQQRQALENLAQLTIGRIREEAVDGHAEDIAEKKKNARFLGKVWIGVKDSFTKKFDIVEREKKMASEIQNGGIDEHKVVLEQMVKGMKELGPAIKEGEGGQLEVQFVETDGMSPELSKVAEAFNEQGTKFSKIPYEWSLDTATPAQQEAFNDAKETYELQRGVLMGHMAEAGGDVMATKAMAKTESVIEMQRFIQTAPDAAEELKNIEDQNAWTAALKSVGTERGLYMAGGALARTALGVVAGFVAAPIVASASAGIRGWRKAGETLVAQDKAQRAGEEIPQTEKMKQAEARIVEINTALANVDDEHVKSELSAELSELNTVARGTTKNMIEAVRSVGEDEPGYRGSVAKIDALVGKLKQAEDAGADTAAIASQLKRRIAYTQLKISEGKMVFGGKAERLANQYALTRSLGDAEAMLAVETATDVNGEKATARLEKLLGKTDEEIASAEFRFKRNQALRAGAIGGVLAGAGAELADAVKWMNGGSGTLTESMLGSASTAKAGVAEAYGAVVGGVSAMKEGIGEAYSSAAENVQEIGDHLAQNAELMSKDAQHLFSQEGAQEIGSDITKGLRAIRVMKDNTTFEANFPDSSPLTGNESVNGLDLPPDYKFPSQEVAAYSIKEGDNLTKILGADVEKLRTLSPEQLVKMGIASGNIDKIKAGDSLNVAELKSYISGLKSETNISDHIQVPKAKFTYVPEPKLADAPEGSGDIFGTPDEIRNMGGTLEADDTLDGVETDGGVATVVEAPVTAPVRVETIETVRAPQIVEARGLVPSRALSEFSDAELEKWPSNKPMPWPVSEREVVSEFGKAGSPEHMLADGMKKIMGRYPSTAELESYDHTREIDAVAAANLLNKMKDHPLSVNEIADIKMRTPGFTAKQDIYDQQVLAKEASATVRPIEAGLDRPIDVSRVTDPQMQSIVRIFYSHNGRLPTNSEATDMYKDYFGKSTATTGGVVRAGSVPQPQRVYNPNADFRPNVTPIPGPHAPSGQAQAIKAVVDVVARGSGDAKVQNIVNVLGKIIK